METPKDINQKFDVSDTDLPIETSISIQQGLINLELIEYVRLQPCGKPELLIKDEEYREFAQKLHEDIILKIGIIKKLIYKL